MKELPKFVNEVNMGENDGVYDLSITLHYKERDRPYNRLSHLVIKDWINHKLGRLVDLETFEGPNAISNKTGANTGRWTFKLLEEKPKKTKKSNSKKTTKKEEKELDKYEEMTYPLPSKD